MSVVRRIKDQCFNVLVAIGVNRLWCKGNAVLIGFNGHQSAGLPKQQTIVLVHGFAVLGIHE